MNWITILHTIAALIILLLLVPFIVFAVPQVVGAEQSFVVVSSSMQPTIPPGAAIIVNNVSARAIDVGDIITFRERTGGDVVYVTHRVVDIVERSGTVHFRTQGDANAQPDAGLVSPDELVGRVVFTIPYLGHVIALVQSTVGLILLVGVPITLLILSEIWDLFRAYRADWRSGYVYDRAPTPQETVARSEPEINVTELDSRMDWSSKSQPPSESQPPLAERTAKSTASFPTHRLLTQRPPEKLTVTQIAEEFRDIERLSGDERQEYEQYGYDIEQRRDKLIEEIEERTADLEELKEYIDRL